MNRDIQDLAQAVRAYVHAEHAVAVNEFTWALNESTLEVKLGIKVAGATSYDRNIDLKVKLAALWQMSGQAGRERIAEYYVRDWGGIKRNTPAKLAGYVHAANAGALLPLAGVASWSKVLAAADPMNQAIFDARVSLSLNALQAPLRLSPRWLFPVLPSQNGGVQAAGPLFEKRADQEGWGTIPRALVYLTYIRVLRIAAEGLPGPLPLATAEMVLFSRTEALVPRVGADTWNPLPVAPHFAQ